MKEYFSLVTKPVRYLGRELGSIKKDLSKVRLKFCLAFPDVYEVGMSHLGIQILYHILNKREEISCERVFAPWIDMENLIRRKGIPLSSLESSLPLNQFDIIGFSLQYELCFTNVLNMLSLSHIPLLSKDRDETYPLIIAGGPSTFNPEPISDFFDAIVIGDGEEVVLEICDVILSHKENESSKDDLLNSLAKLEGVYVPAKHIPGEKIKKRLVMDLDHAPFPTFPIVPYMRVVHDRLSIEIARGCKRGCRFCEAGFIHRPYRERSPDLIEEIVSSSLKKTGYEEFSLLSLSAGDYTSIESLLSRLMDQWESKKVAVSLPSLRIENIMGNIADEIKRVRKTGFTLAPEAATERLQRVINKYLDEGILFQGVKDIFSKGWKNIKLYFMIGLPTERDEDLEGIVNLAKKILSLGDKEKIHPNITVSVSTFVPKPHTPFQWASQISLEEMKEKLQFLKSNLNKAHINFKWQDPHMSLLEGIFSLGDRRLSSVLIEAKNLGCRFDGWSDQFKYSLWKEAFERAGIDMNYYTREKRFEDKLPWSFIDTGLTEKYLWKEYENGLSVKTSPSCSGRDCIRCGVCDGENIFIKEGGSLKNEIYIKRKVVQRRNRIKRRIRLKFKKVGEMRFLSHLELAHLFYRASKRADLPLRFSEGFHPMPRIIFSTALPVGVESLAEFMDIELEGRITPDEVMKRLNQTLPIGIEIIEAREIPTFFNLLPPERTSYWIPLDNLFSKDEAENKIKEALKRDSLPIAQKRKEEKRIIDVKPFIEAIELKEDSSQWGIELTIRNIEGKTVKASEVLQAIIGLEKDSEPVFRIVKLG